MIGGAGVLGKISQGKLLVFEGGEGQKWLGGFLVAACVEDLGKESLEELGKELLEELSTVDVDLRTWSSLVTTTAY